MILNRISEAISKKSWSTVTIELLILVVGIFLGLQVDDWNEARKDRADEQLIIERLHDDVLLADQVTLRIRDRMLDRLDRVKIASERLSSDAAPTELESETCTGIVATSMTSITAPRLASFDELVGTGRLDIIRNPELLSALLSLEQYRSALTSLVTNFSAEDSLVYLPAAFPDLMRTSTYLEPDTEEIRIAATCDLEAMRANPAFLNQFNFNADTYDVFIRDGLQPWNEQFSRVHSLLDEALGIAH